MSYSFIVDIIRESRTIPSIRVRNDIGRGILNELEKGVKAYLGKDGHTYEGDTMYLFQHPERKIILATQKTDDESFFYAFLDSDGNALPDPECYGEVRGKQETVQEFRERLASEFTELGYVY